MLFRALLLLIVCSTAFAQADRVKGAAGELEDPGSKKHAGTCKELPSQKDLQRLLREAPAKGEAGGIFSGKLEWAAVVDRKGQLCAVAVATDDPAMAWGGSRGIAIAKATTANGFSTDQLAMSTARLYTLSQPGHSLFGAGAGNPMNPDCLSATKIEQGKGKLCGGTIAFGGGVALYKGQTRVGGLGVSGDTPCADHEIAKRMRTALGMNPVKGEHVDDIQYEAVDGPSIYAHPFCANTWRDGKKLGDERPSK